MQAVITYCKAYNLIIKVRNFRGFFVMKVIGKYFGSQVMCYLHLFTVDKLINSSTCETPIFNRHFCLSLKRENNLYYKEDQKSQKTTRLKRFSFLRCWVNNHLPLVIVPQKFEPKIKMLPFDWSKSNLNQFYQEQLPKKGDILNQLFITSVYHVGCIDSI